MTRVALLLLALAAVAQAQDEFYETAWIVGEDGGLLGWPDPELGGEMLKTFKPFPVFKDLAAELAEQPLWWAGLLVAAGPTDMASLCDPERHLKKTNESLFDEQLLLWATGEMPRDLSDPKARRLSLDRILRMRVLGSRRAQAAVGWLTELSTLDPITRRAAADVVAMIEGRRLPAVELGRLAAIPLDSDVLIVVDQRRIPPWRDYWRILRTYWTRSSRQVIARVGAAIAPSDFCDAQWVLDRDSEMFYEVARRFGNARLDRTTLALRFRPGAPAEFQARAEGTFEFEQLAAGCVALGAKVQPREDSTGVELNDVSIRATRDTFAASRGTWKLAEAGIPADLAALGLGGDDAIWIHCRKVPFADKLPVKGVETLTLRASFDGGVMLRCRAGFGDAEAAKAAAAEMERWKGLKLEPATIGPVPLHDVNPAAIARVRVFLASLAVSVEGATLTAECSAKGETPESLLAGVVDVAAVYPWEEEGEGAEAK